MTKEEVDLAIESGDADVINKVLSGELNTIIDSEEVDEGEGEAEPAESTSTTEEDSSTGVDIDEELAAMEKLVKEKAEKEKNELSAQVANAKAEAERIKEELDRVKSEKALEKSRTMSEVALEEDEDDVDLAGTYSKNNRLLIDELKNKLADTGDNSVVSDIVDRLEKMEQADSERTAKLKQETADNAEKERMNRLFKEVDEFQSTHKNLSLPRNIKEVNHEMGEFRSSVAKLLGVEESNVIEKAVRGVLSGESRYNKLTEKLKVNSIEMPQNSAEYYRLADLVDVRNGYKYNKLTGEYDAITDDLGNHIIQRSLNDAYLLSGGIDKEIANAEKRQSVEIQKILNGREESATVLPVDSAADATEVTKMTNEEMEAIFATDSSKIRKSPELSKRLQQAFKQLKG